MRSSAVASIVTASCALVALWGRTSVAMAQERPRTYVLKDQTTTTGPNRQLLRSGIWTLGLAYVPALVVATQSEREADKRLYFPVAGPWLDLGARGKCPAVNGCNYETTYKVLISLDGVFQGIGALNVLGAFLFPETRTVSGAPARRTASSEGRSKSPSLRIAPTRIGRAYGIVASGTF